MADVTVEFGATDTGLEKTLKAVQSELDGLKSKVKGGELSMTELESTMKRIGQVESMEKRIKSIGDQSEEAGEKAKKAAGIFDDEFKRIGAAFTVGNLASAGFQKAISLAFDAARAVVQGFSDALNLGGRLSELSTRTGEAAGTLLVLETAFKNSGLEASQVGQVINKLQNFMQDATNGGEKQAKVMRDLGISFADLAGKTPSDQMQVFAEKIAGIQDPTQRAAMASEVFGEKLGGKLLPLLVDFSGNLEDARGKVGSLEQVMNENAATFDKFSESIDAVKAKITAFSAGILSETVPSLQKLGSEMEGVDATEFGKIIGQIVNPAISDLTKNISLAADIFGTLKNAASNVGSGLKDQSEEFKEGATQANKYLQVISALLPGGLDPLGLGFKSIANVSNEATKGINEISVSANDAKPVLSDLASKATESGDKINTAFTLTSDLKPELDSIGNGWSEITDNVKTNNSLLDGTALAFDSIAQKTEEQAAGIGGINEQLATSENLNKLILDLNGKIADKESDAAEKAAKKLKEQADKEAEKNAEIEKTIALKREEVNLQIAIANAISSGNTQEAERLKGQDALNKSIQDMIKSGMGEEEATKLANELARAAREADRVKNSLATKIGEDIKKKQESEAIDKGGKLMQKAQEQISQGRYREAEATSAKIKSNEQEAMIRGTGQGRDIRAIRDIARDYGLDQMKSESELKKELYKIRTEGETAEKNLKKGVESAQKGLGKGMQKEQATRESEKKTPMTLESMVKAIQTAVEKLETKLPQPILA